MPKPFVPPGTKTHFAPDRPAAVRHVRLEIAPDFETRTVSGISRLELVARRDGLERIELHAVDMEIGEILVDDSPPRAIDYDGQRLRITFPKTYARQARLSVSVGYRCAPRQGLYFLGPDATNPNRPLQCWTQGQDEDSRHYWPCIDTPLEKATSELICTAKRGFFVLSNGELRERRDLDGDRTRWHYALDLPHAPYLVTLVCGNFTETKDRSPSTGVDVYYYAPPGREQDARRTLGRTPEMIDVFSQKIGVRYPHARYSQIFVSDFIFGGMENTTATTLTDQALIDERAALDYDVEALVAHELAHQWWGDLLTCREWSEAWLNEGFATYFEYIWREHAHGRDEADCEYLTDAETYLNESRRYQRPIVCRQYEEPIHLFDAHLYEKGGRVLHMLRHELGDEGFWRALKLYAERHAGGVVETRDLARAVEEASGRTLDGFFDQWIARPGHPVIEGSWSWDDERGVGVLRLEQKQEGEGAYRISTRVRFEIDGDERDEAIVFEERARSFEFALSVKPTQVVFDPGDVTLKSMKLEKPRGLWIRQLEAARLAVDRVCAAHALGEQPEPQVVAALRAALTGDSFWAVRAAAARALGETRRPDALEALLAARGEKHPKVRRSIVAALGEFRRNERAAEALSAWLEAGDPSVFVEGSAALALGKTRSPRALAVLPRLLQRDTFQDVVRARALEGLGASGDEAAGPLLRGAYRPEATFQARRAAVAALARLAEGTAEARHARELAEEALEDSDFRVRMEAAAALVTLQDPRSVEPLERAVARELDGRPRRRYKDAIAELLERGRPVEQAKKLGEEVERLRDETLKLRERLEKLEGGARVAAPPVAPKAGRPGPRRPPPPARRTTKPSRRKR